MTYLGQPLAITDLPDGWWARRPDDRDVPAVVSLLTSLGSAGAKPVDVDSVAANLVGVGSWTRRQVIIEDRGTLLGWAVVHDRAAGRTNVQVTVAPEASSDRVARALYAWVDGTAAVVAALRGLPQTQLDATVPATDVRTRQWLTDAGYEQVRTWLQMSRPVTPADAVPGALPPTRPGVSVRRVRAHVSGLPIAEDVRTVHQVLEESFVDHFNSYRESISEFTQRLSQDPWHRWDHWWIASVEVDGEPQPGGVVVSSVSSPDADGRYGSYLDYLGVHRRARGRGVAKALLNTVISDAARNDRHWVGLEVDADSPTGADGLYRSYGWAIDATTESWHRYVDAATAP